MHHVAQNPFTHHHSLKFWITLFTCRLFFFRFGWEHSSVTMSSSTIGKFDQDDFYCRLLLLSSLQTLDKDKFHNIKRMTGPSRQFMYPASVPHNIELQEAEDYGKLRNFLDCLAEICASKRAGSTVTAVTVHLVGNPPRPQYIFVSNNRSAQEANDAKTHVEYILRTFGGPQICSGSPQTQDIAPDVRGAVLRKVLEFCQNRFRNYIKTTIRCFKTLDRRKDLNKRCKCFLRILSGDKWNCSLPTY